jgi:glycosyltransferase involved in cell wall biosynthesis
LAEILLVHNYYQQKGGEDVVFSSERDLLINAGHDVITYERHNGEILNYSSFQKIKFSYQTIWGGNTLKELDQLLLSQRPRIVHFHNTFPLISPAAYAICRNRGAAVVQTLHNFRLLCPEARLFRSGAPCELCLHKNVKWPGVIHACYHGSIGQTSVIAAMLAYHRFIKTWGQQVNRYIVLSSFSRQKFIEGGLPRDKIVVKPNFVSLDPGGKISDKRYTLIIGRLSPEKGIDTLMKSWELLPHIPLKILGDGPLLPFVQEYIKAKNLGNIEILGWQSREAVIALLREASFLIFPSTCYENFGMTIIEAYACGLPVIAARLGAPANIISEGRTGLLFDPGNENDLSKKVDWAWNHPNEINEMGVRARKEYESSYTAQKNYELLINVYAQAAAVNKGIK